MPEINADLTAFIDQMPKAELHLHLEGTLEPELKVELAARNGVSLPYASAAQLRAGYAFRDLTSFLPASGAQGLIRRGGPGSAGPARRVRESCPGAGRTAQPSQPPQPSVPPR